MIYTLLFLQKTKLQKYKSVFFVWAFNVTAIIIYKKIIVSHNSQFQISLL